MINSTLTLVEDFSKKRKQIIELFKTGTKARRAKSGYNFINKKKKSQTPPFEQNASRTINFRQNLKMAIEMIWTPPQNKRQSLAREDLPVDTARQEEKKKKKTATVMEEPSDGLPEKQ